MIDNDIFRLGVGIIVCNTQDEVLWAKRRGKETWQFPQGGIDANEPLEKALYRELEEEIGLTASDVQLLGNTQGWLTYLWPESVRLMHMDPHCLGQKQKWFLLRLISEDTAIYLNNTNPPEFDQWRWVNYWYPLDHIVSFKKQAYHQALHELAHYR
jgi:putative (di)nucleoside polyphosphate hydrolase